MAYSREGLLQAPGPQGFQFLFVPWFPLLSWRRQCGGQGHALAENADLEMSLVPGLEGARIFLPHGPHQDKGSSPQHHDHSRMSNPHDPQSRGALRGRMETHVWGCPTTAQQGDSLRHPLLCKGRWDNCLAAFSQGIQTLK